MNAEIFKTIMKFKIILPVFLSFLLLSGCSSWNIFGKREPSQATPESIYALASEEYQNGDYKSARQYFMRVKEEYPLHDMAVLAEIGIADSYYSDKEYAEAQDAYSDFISLHPVNENVPYAMYQIGMCHYNQMEAIDRDQTETIEARKEWEKLISRYPESKFSIMAEKMLKDVKRRLAEREFYVGSFYFTQGKYKAALARFEKIASEYNNVGFDYKIEYNINETKAKIAEEEKIKLREEEKKAQEEAERKKKEEEKLKKEEAKKEADRIKKEEEKKKAEEKKAKEEAEKKKKEEEKLKKEEAKKEADRIKEEEKAKKEAEKTTDKK